MTLVDVTLTDTPPSDRMLIDALCIVLGKQLHMTHEWGGYAIDIDGGDQIVRRAEQIVENYGRMALLRISQEARPLKAPSDGDSNG